MRRKFPDPKQEAIIDRYDLNTVDDDWSPKNQGDESEESVVRNALSWIFWFIFAVAVTALFVYSGVAIAGGMAESGHSTVINCVGMREKHIIAAHCQGETEVSIPGGRVDCVDHRAVYEYGDARNWKEDVGQVLFYGKAFPEKQMVIRLIARNDWGDIDHLVRAKDTVDKWELDISFENLVCANGLYDESQRWIKRFRPGQFDPPY